MRADADDTTLVEVLGGVLAHVGDIRGKFLHTAFGLTHLQAVFVHMHRSEDILFHHALVEHDGVLVVVTLPGHERHFQVASQGELAVLGGIALGKYVAGLHALTLVADRAKVDCGALVGLAPLRDDIFFYRFLERYEILLLGAVVADADCGGIHEFYHTVTLGHNLGAGIAHELSLDTGTHDRSLGTHQRHCLAHHV